MRKYIEIPMEVLERLVDGKRVEGALRRDCNTGQIVFKAYSRKPYKRNKDKRVYKVCSWFVTMNLVFFGFALFSGQVPL